MILKQGKVLSSARVDTHIVQETEQFIEQWGKVVERKRIMKFNVVVFDKTVASDPTKSSKVAEFRDKGAARVCRVCEKRLCVQIPFSSNDGRTLFIAHIFKVKNRTWCKKRLHGGSASRESLPAKSPPTALLHHANRLPERRRVFSDHQRVFGRLEHRAPWRGVIIVV